MQSNAVEIPVLWHCTFLTIFSVAYVKRTFPVETDVPEHVHLVVDNSSEVFELEWTAAFQTGGHKHLVDKLLNLIMTQTRVRHLHHRPTRVKNHAHLLARRPLQKCGGNLSYNISFPKIEKKIMTRIRVTRKIWTSKRLFINAERIFWPYSKRLNRLIQWPRYLVVRTALSEERANKNQSSPSSSAANARSMSFHIFQQLNPHVPYVLPC